MSVYPRNYEIVRQQENEGGTIFIGRLKVPGGWVLSEHAVFENSSSNSLVFVPDPNHEWQLECELNSLPVEQQTKDEVS